MNPYPTVLDLAKRVSVLEAILHHNVKRVLAEPFLGEAHQSELEQAHKPVDAGSHEAADDLAKRALVKELAEAGYACAMHMGAEHHDRVLRMAKAYNDAVLARVIDGPEGYLERLLKHKAAKPVDAGPACDARLLPGHEAERDFQKHLAAERGDPPPADDALADPTAQALSDARKEIAALRAQLAEATERAEAAVARNKARNAAVGHGHIDGCAAVSDARDGFDHIRDCNCQQRYDEARARVAEVERLMVAQGKHAESVFATQRERLETQTENINSLQADVAALIAMCANPKGSLP